MSDNKSPLDDDPRTQVEDWMHGNGAMIAGACLLLIVIGFVYYALKSLF